MFLSFVAIRLFLTVYTKAVPATKPNDKFEWQYFRKESGLLNNAVLDQKDVSEKQGRAGPDNWYGASPEYYQETAAVDDEDNKPVVNKDPPPLDEVIEGFKPDYMFENTGSKKYHAESYRYSHANSAMNWPLGIIPYHMDTKSFDDILAKRVRSTMDHLEASSCLQFRPLKSPEGVHHAWINVTNPGHQRECVHDVTVGPNREIKLILGLECLKRQDLLHSLLHAIGFKDEVTHPHRDQYIRVVWENIQPKYLRLFRLASANVHSTEYDPMSIMHFHDRAFSKNGQTTIAPLMSGLQIQPSDTLSQLDKMKLRLTFGHECSRRTVDNLFDTCKSVLHNDAEPGPRYQEHTTTAQPDQNTQKSVEETENPGVATDTTVGSITKDMLSVNKRYSSSASSSSSSKEASSSSSEEEKQKPEGKTTTSEVVPVTSKKDTQKPQTGSTKDPYTERLIYEDPSPADHFNYYEGETTTPEVVPVTSKKDTQKPQTGSTKDPVTGRVIFEDIPFPNADPIENEYYHSPDMYVSPEKTVLYKVVKNNYDGVTEY